MWKNFHPVNGAGIRTHNLRNMSVLPLLLDQGSRYIILRIQKYVYQYIYQSVDGQIKSITRDQLKCKTY